MAAARPVVASRVGGVPEQVVDGETGFIVAPGDPRALAEALATALSDRSRLVSMGQAGRRHFDRAFAPDQLVQRYLDLYGRVARESAPRRGSRFG
jgi:glycosyltransferase involved in cell wall biosynthesis